MKKGTPRKKEEGYSPAEMRLETEKIIEESVARLRTRLRAAWKKDASNRRRVRYETAV